MKLETFFDNFEMLAEAPNGVKTMRELILELAVRGKLVAQDDGDEPASILLKSIRDQIKKSSNSIEENEMSYNIPKTWERVHLGDILVFEYGDGLPKSKRAENAKYPVYGSNGIVGYHDEFLIDKPGIIVGRKGSCGALNVSLEPFWATDVSYYIIPPTGIDLKFAYILLKSLNLERLGKGIKPGLNRNEAYQVVTSLPPYNEQRRIVARVDQLMSLCDELEARQQKTREARAQINSAALDRLLTARAPGEFAEGWRRISDNFDLLYDVPENVGALRKVILQLAVMGKLVEQDANDEPASVLLEKIKVEKEKLITEKKIRKSEILSPILADEIQHDLPENWTWIRLADICELITDGTHQTPNYTNNGRIFLSAQNVKPFRFMPENCRYVSEEDYQEYVRNRKAQFEDVLLTRVGAGIGEAAVIDKKMDFAFYVSIALIRPMKRFIDPFYLNIFLNSPIGTEKSKLNTYGKGVSQGNLNLGLIKKFIVSIPPLNEQHRIVARVDQLISLCDKLEAGLMRSQADSEKLIEAVVGRMLAGGDNA